jgi:hypothetical protein
MKLRWVGKVDVDNQTCVEDWILSWDYAQDYHLVVHHNSYLGNNSSHI